jgi:hypothetical protein
VSALKGPSYEAITAQSRLIVPIANNHSPRETLTHQDVEQAEVAMSTFLSTRRALRGRGRRALEMVGAMVLASSGLGVVLAAPTAAGASPPAGYVCSGGSPTSPTMIPAGDYGPMTVTGFCAMQGSYDITGGLTIAPDAELDAAVFFGFPPYTYGAPCNVFVTVSGGIRVQQQGVLYFGNGPGTGCPSSNDVVNGGITAVGADTVVVHGTTINGRFSAIGGGGGTSCNPTADSPFSPYTDIEDSAVNGGATYSGINTCWMGFIRNQVSGTVKVVNNTMGDPDAIEIGLNTINGSLACSGNALAFPGPGGVPTNSFDGSPPNPNTVTGAETGQCAGL